MSIHQANKIVRESGSFGEEDFSLDDGGELSGPGIGAGGLQRRFTSPLEPSLAPTRPTAASDFGKDDEQGEAEESPLATFGCARDPQAMGGKAGMKAGALLGGMDHWMPPGGHAPKGQDGDLFGEHCGGMSPHSPFGLGAEGRAGHGTPNVGAFETAGSEASGMCGEDSRVHDQASGLRGEDSCAGGPAGDQRGKLDNFVQQMQQAGDQLRDAMSRMISQMFEQMQQMASQAGGSGAPQPKTSGSSAPGGGACGPGDKGGGKSSPFSLGESRGCGGGTPPMGDGFSTGISGVEDAERAMAAIAKAAKDKLKQLSAQLKAAGEKESQGGAQGGAQGAQQGGSDKDQIMLQIQIAMAEWSQATQAQTNLRSKNDKTIDAVVGNLR